MSRAAEVMECSGNTWRTDGFFFALSPFFSISDVETSWYDTASVDRAAALFVVVVNLEAMVCEQRGYDDSRRSLFQNQ
jgi:hypothetical protein